MTPENKEVILCDTCKQPLTDFKYAGHPSGHSRFYEPHDPLRCITNMLRELLDSQPNTRTKSKIRARRKTRLPSDWKISAEQRAYCKNKRPDLNPDQVEENFRDYWLGCGTTKMDWNRVWQTWVRKEKPQKLNGALPRGLPALEAHVKKHQLPAARPGESEWDWRSRLEVAQGN